MHEKPTLRNKDGGLILAGLVGLGVAVLFSSCGGSDETSGGTAATTASGTGGDSTPGVTPSCDSDPTTAENTAAVAAAANALLAAITPEQQTAIKYDKNLANAQQWSNLPVMLVERNGVKIGDMSPEAQAAASALVDAAAGATGSMLLSEIREADEFLVTDGKASPTSYGRGLYYVSIHGTPSTSSPWMLQIAGHHLGYNFTYGGKCTSATPLFDGVEPMTWMDANGQMHAPLEAQRAAMVAMLTAISSQPDVKLGGTFSDIVNGPVGGGPAGGGKGDTKYPSGLTYPTGTAGRGVLVSTLSAEQKSLVKTAIEAWVKNVADPVSNALLAVYESDEALGQTYVGYTGSTDLTTQSSYARIDGPRVWIELTVQPGIVYKDRVHYHTIWRDKAADYGAEYVSQ